MDRLEGNCSRVFFCYVNRRGFVFFIFFVNGGLGGDDMDIEGDNENNF